jgi:hypothetical protein
MKQSPYRQVGPCAVIPSTATLSGKLTQKQRSRFIEIWMSYTEIFTLKHFLTRLYNRPSELKTGQPPQEQEASLQKVLGSNAYSQAQSI